MVREALRRELHAEHVAISVGPELGLLLARLDFGLMFGRFALDAENRLIWFDESILGEGFREEELRFASGPLERRSRGRLPRSADWTGCYRF